ncbi:MAG TPA: hypothetical protein VG206_17145 [Terriglobia bacterium]|nr:hypothetical protein [Terriglobia bacterium]
MVDSHAGIDLLQFCQTLEEQRSAADQHHRSRNFTDHDSPAHRCARPGRSTRRPAHRVGQPAEGSLQGRKQAREDQDSHHGRGGEPKNPQIHAEIGCKRQRCRHQRSRGTKHQCAQGDTRHASEKSVFVAACCGLVSASSLST